MDDQNNKSPILDFSYPTVPNSSDDSQSQATNAPVSGTTDASAAGQVGQDNGADVATGIPVGASSSQERAPQEPQDSSPVENGQANLPASQPADKGTATQNDPGTRREADMTGIVDTPETAAVDTVQSTQATGRQTPDVLDSEINKDSSIPPEPTSRPAGATEPVAPVVLVHDDSTDAGEVESSNGIEDLSNSDATTGNEQTDLVDQGIETDDTGSVKETDNVEVLQTESQSADPAQSPTPPDQADQSVVNAQSSTAEEAAQGGKTFSIHELLNTVVLRDASDLHITAGYEPSIRVDGSLVPIGKEVLTPQQTYDMIMQIIPDGKKDLLDVNKEIDMAYAFANKARFRVNAYYQQGSLSAAFRLIPEKIRSLEDLQLPEIYQSLTKLRQGLVLVTGPTGSGKSTTLAAIINQINMTRREHIITIEDPIEYIFPKAQAMVDQREMHEDSHSWAVALRSAMRQDPDIILVGEMRDYETISAAITLAETGHLVFATLHTNSASQTIDRIIDVFPEHQQSQIRMQLSLVIKAVISQRLIPLDAGGRRAVSEIMLATPAIRNLIREAKTYQIDNIISTSTEMGMRSIEKDLVKLVREGHITSDKAQEYAVHPEEVVRLLKAASV